MTSQDTAQPRYFVVVTTKTFRSLAEARERARPGIGDPCRIRIPSYVVWVGVARSLRASSAPRWFPFLW
jgi:hypothetical protein